MYVCIDTHAHMHVHTRTFLLFSCLSGHVTPPKVGSKESILYGLGSLLAALVDCQATLTSEPSLMRHTSLLHAAHTLVFSKHLCLLRPDSLLKDCLHTWHRILSCSLFRSACLPISCSRFTVSSRPTQYITPHAFLDTHTYPRTHSHKHNVINRGGEY